jgi:hypothetical protein
LSSAILYAAIIAIWAGALIPRWLRRDSSRESARFPEYVADQSDDEVTVPTADADYGPGPPPRRAHRGRAPDPRRSSRDERRDTPYDREHRRVLSARRRLLALLMVLFLASGALAYTRLAASWVVLPPSVMLLGYLGILRSASKADAERRGQSRRPAPRTGALAGGRTESRAGAPAGAVAGAGASGAGGGPAVSRAPRPAGAGKLEAEVIDIAAHGGEIYDQYADAKRRAVGD